MIKSDVLVSEARIKSWEDHGYTGVNPFMDTLIDSAVKAAREKIGPDMADVEAVYEENGGLDSLTIIVAPVHPPRDPESPWPLVHVTHDVESGIWVVQPYPTTSGAEETAESLVDAMHIAARKAEAQITRYGLGRPVAGPVE